MGKSQIFKKCAWIYVKKVKKGEIYELSVIFDTTYRIVLDKIISETLFPKSAQMIKDRKQPKQLTPTHSSKWSSSKISFENFDTFFPEGKLAPLSAPDLSPPLCQELHAPSQSCECLSPHQSMSIRDLVYDRAHSLASCLAHSILFICLFFHFLLNLLGWYWSTWTYKYQVWVSIVTRSVYCTLYPLLKIKFSPVSRY